MRRGRMLGAPALARSQLSLALLRRRSGLVITRSEWDAAPPRRGYQSRGRLRFVVLHHTSFSATHLAGAAVAAEAAHMREIQASHLERGFIDVGYHFVIMPSGRIFLGRPLSALGAHVYGRNSGSVGVSLAGDFDTERPTEAAIASLEQVLRHLAPRGGSVPLTGHRDLADTRCPGDFLHPYVTQLGAAGEGEGAAVGRR